MVWQNVTTSVWCIVGANGCTFDYWGCHSGKQCTVIFPQRVWWTNKGVGHVYNFSFGGGAFLNMHYKSASVYLILKGAAADSCSMCTH
jgi:hypothetical protein